MVAPGGVLHCAIAALRSPCASSTVPGCPFRQVEDVRTKAMDEFGKQFPSIIRPLLTEREEFMVSWKQGWGVSWKGWRVGRGLGLGLWEGGGLRALRKCSAGWGIERMLHGRTCVNTRAYK